MFKNAFAICLIFVSSLSLSAASEPDYKTKSIDQIFTYFHSEQVFDQMVDRSSFIVETFLAESFEPEEKQALQAVPDLLRKLSGPILEVIKADASYKVQFYESFAEEYSVDELQRLSLFFTSGDASKLAQTQNTRTLLLVGALLSNLDQINTIVEDSMTEADLSEWIGLLSEQPEELKDLARQISGARPKLDGEPIKTIKRGRSEIETPDIEARKKGVCTGENTSEKRVPVLRNPPVYPFLAQRYALEGWVELNYSIEADGTTSDILVTNASTGTIFNQPAVNAVEQYIFCPGERKTANRMRLRFEMAR